MNKKNFFRNDKYFLNEYSLRGQFKSLEDFFESLRLYTFPVLDNIDHEDGSILLKKSSLWECKVYSNYTIYDVSVNTKERYAASPALKIKLQKILCNPPYWDDTDAPKLTIQRYHFDDEYRSNFADDNCFRRAAECNGYIVSFWHDSYKEQALPVDVLSESKNGLISIPNIACVEHWPVLPFIRKWDIDDTCFAYVRLRESDRHQPHFHVKSTSFSGSFDLENGDCIIHCKDKKAEYAKICRKVKDWYPNHQEELIEAWKSTHICPYNLQ